jgi:WD40 repeat protein/predicted Ser/Thr protein kinase
MADGSETLLEAGSSVDDVERAESEPMPVPVELAPGTRIDRYEVLERLGAGGMGVVYAATDTVLGRRIALKLVRPDRARGSDDATRLLREAQALASLSHPNVVTIHDVGAVGDELFIAMELVDGCNLATWASRASHDVRRTLEVLCAAGRGLAAAHAAGIIHRDFKPENVLIGDDGVVRVTDFGVARLVEGEATTERALAITLTRPGMLVGTPAYMAPEQLDGGRITAAADQFAFCVTAYELVYGLRPFRAESIAECRAAIARQRLATPPRSVRVPRGVHAAIARGLAIDPAARHASMEVLLRLLEPRTRRLRLVAGVGVAGAIAAIVMLGRTPDPVDHAGADEIIIERARAALEIDPTAAIAQLAALDPGSDRWRDARLIAADAASRGVAHVLRGDGPAELLAFSDDSTRLAAYEMAGGRVRIWDLTTATDRVLHVGDALIDVELAGDDVVGLGRDGTVWRWDARTGARALVRTITIEPPVTFASIAPGARWIVLFDRTRQLQLVELEGGQRALGEYRFAVWSPDARALFAYDRTRRRVDRIDLETGGVSLVADELAQLIALATDGSSVWSIVHDRDSAKRHQSPWRMIMSLTTRTTWRVPTPIDQLVVLQPGTLATSAMRTAATDGPPEHNLMITDGGDVAVPLRGATHARPIAASRDGTLASADLDGTIRIWRRPRVVRRHGDGASTASHALLTPRTLVMTRLGPILEVHDLATRALQHLAVTEFPPDVPAPRTLRGARVTQVGERRFSEQTRGPTTEVTSLVASANRRRMATLDDASHAVFWDLDAGKGRRIADHVVHIAISPDGTRMATARDDRVLELWDLATFAPTRLGELSASAIAFGPGNQLVACTLDGSSFVFAPDREPDRAIAGGDVQRAIAFSPDGQTLVLGGDSSAITVLHLASGVTHRLPGHAAPVTRIVMAPDGRRFVSASTDGMIRVWNAGMTGFADGTAIALRGHTDAIASIELGPDDTLVSASADKTARIWDLRSGKSRALVGHSDRVLYAGHLSTTRVVVVDRLRQIAEYPDDLPYDGLLLRAWLASMTNVMPAER